MPANHHPQHQHIMAVKLSANYSKKLGLPEYSSHSFAVSVEVELTDVTQVDSECERLYQLLQQAVDREIQHTGFIPKPGFGHNGNGNHNGRSAHNGNGRHQTSNGHQQPQPGHGERWNCTDGQRGFILRIISDNKLDPTEPDSLAQQLFGVGVKQLNKMQASQLIEDLLVMAGKPARQNRWQQRQTAPANAA